MILDYIRSTIEILMSIKFDGTNGALKNNTELSNERVLEKSIEKKDLLKDYELMIQKLEAETRDHIRVICLINVILITVSS